jgi:hypothetical protein
LCTAAPPRNRRQASCSPFGKDYTFKRKEIDMDPAHHYWFPAKRYGWGWGLPIAWQGWLVLGIFVALVLSAAFFVLPRSGPLVFYGLVGFLVACLALVCWYTGEPARWRWGSK